MKRTLKAADLFCGAGGTSTGLLRACERLGHRVELTAINHWDVAIATHTENHPGARHLCTSIDDVNPRSLFKEGELDVLWASPECTHHSIARGGKPISDQSRATAWCVVRWAEALRPSVILVENVPEFESWGGLCTKGRPLKTKRGETFIAWVRCLESLGYRVDWRVLCAADYGDPTTRRRLFVQAVRGRRSIVWPDPTHAPIEEGDLFGSRKKWVAAREIIDWGIPAPSIYGRKRPLSEKTMRRIMEGLKKFGLKAFIVPGYNEREGQTPRTHDVEAPLPTVAATGHTAVAQPFLICMEHKGSVRSSDKPMPTITTAKGGAIGVAKPFLVELRGTSEEQLKNTARSIEDPTPTITAGGGHIGVVEPFLVQVAHGNGADANGDARRSKSVDAPLPTVCGAGGEWALCEPYILPQHAGAIARPVTQPVPTVACDGAVALVEPFLVSYYGTGNAASVDDPMETVTTKDRFGLARPVVRHDGKDYLLDIGFRMLQPHELAAAQGFQKGYRFTGNKTQQVKQIGNAVPGNLAEAIVRAVIAQDPNA